MTIRTQTTVLSGNRIEIANPNLPEGQRVAVTIDVPSVTARESGHKLIEFLKSLPPNRRTPAEWEEYDRQFRAERDAWER